MSLKLRIYVVFIERKLTLCHKSDLPNWKITVLKTIGNADHTHFSPHFSPTSARPSQRTLVVVVVVEMVEVTLLLVPVELVSLRWPKLSSKCCQVHSHGFSPHVTEDFESVMHKLKSGAHSFSDPTVYGVCGEFTPFLTASTTQLSSASVTTSVQKEVGLPNLRHMEGETKENKQHELFPFISSLIKEKYGEGQLILHWLFNRLASSIYQFASPRPSTSSTHLF